MVDPSAPPPDPTLARRQAQREMLGLLFVAIVIFILAVAYAWPWVPPRAPTFADRYRFAPVAHGDGRLFVRHTADGVPEAWISDNTSSLPVMRVLAGEVPIEIRESLLSLYPDLYDRTQYPPGVELFRVRSRTWTPDAPVELLDSYVLRDATGDYLLGLIYPLAESVIDYRPPLPQIPAGLAASTAVTQTGIVVSQYPYTGTVLAQPSSHLDGVDCRDLESRQTIALPNSDPIKEHVMVAICEGIGPIEAVSFIDGEPNQRITAVISGTQQSRLALPVRRVAVPDPPPLPDASWTITQFAQAEAWYPGPATTPPVYLPGDPDAVLVTTRGGILSALSTQQPETVLWSWQAGGDVYSTPTIDLRSGRIYFGSTDRRLTALSIDGFFLWHSQVGDNIAAAPILVDDLVIVPSEDANLYAFDAATGAIKWVQSLDSSSVARPVFLETAIGPLVVSATDTGVISAHNLTDGKVEWTTEMDGVIAAGLVASEDTVFGTLLNGTLVALDAVDGAERWTTTVGWPMRFSPVLGIDTLYVHDENGGLVAVDHASGRIRWQNDSVWHVGSPTRLVDSMDSSSEYILSGISDGRVALYDTEGRQHHMWTNPTASPTSSSFTFGAIPGGDAYWLADGNGALWRLGPPASSSTGSSNE